MECHQRDTIGLQIFEARGQRNLGQISCQGVILTFFLELLHRIKQLLNILEAVFGLIIALGFQLSCIARFQQHQLQQLCHRNPVHLGAPTQQILNKFDHRPATAPQQALHRVGINQQIPDRNT